MKSTKGPRSGFNPQTGANTAMKPKPPVKTNALKPSADAEKQIKQPPQPFANKLGPVNLPTTKQFESKGTDYAVEPGAVNKIKSGIKAKPVGHMGLPNQAAVGQKRPINHSGNVFGRFGKNHPKKSRGQNLGASRKNASFYGE